MHPTERPTQPRIAGHDHGDVAELKPLSVGLCDWCGVTLKKSKNGRERRFCSAACRKAWWKRAATRGAQVMHPLQRWRKHRGRAGTPGQGALSAVQVLIDKFADEDRERMARLKKERGET